MRRAPSRGPSWSRATQTRAKALLHGAVRLVVRRPAGRRRTWSTRWPQRDGKTVAALYRLRRAAAALELLRDGRVGRRRRRRRPRELGGERDGRAVRRHDRRADGGASPDPTGAPSLAVAAAASTSARAWSTTPGAMTWNDLVTPDAGRRRGVLRRAVRLDVPGASGRRRLPGDPQRRALQRRHVAARPADGRTPPSWMPYFGHEDVDAAARRGRRARRAVSQRADADARGHDRRARRPAGRGVRGLDGPLRGLVRRRAAAYARAVPKPLIRAALLAAAIASASIAAAPAAARAEPAPFGHACTPQDGVRFCPTTGPRLAAAQLRRHAVRRRRDASRDR